MTAPKEDRADADGTPPVGSDAAPPAQKAKKRRWRRRRFLKYVVGVFAGLAAASTAGYLRIRQIVGWIAETSLPTDVEPGPLDEDTRQTLLRAAYAVLDVPLRPDHYERLFDGRARTIPGFRGLYQRVADALQRASQEAHGRSYAELDPSERRQIVEKVVLSAAPNGVAGKVHTFFSGREGLQYYVHFAVPLFVCYAQTDALLELGYHTWPGLPAGRTAYREAPKDSNWPATPAR